MKIGDLVATYGCGWSRTAVIVDVFTTSNHRMLQILWSDTGKLDVVYEGTLEVINESR